MKSPLCLAQAKKPVNVGMEMPLDEALDYAYESRTIKLAKGLTVIQAVANPTETESGHSAVSPL